MAVRPRSQSKQIASSSEKDARGGRPYNAVLLGVLAVAVFLIATGAPVEKLAGDSPWALISAWDAVLGSALTMAAALGVYLGYRLYRGQLSAFGDLQRLTLAVAALSFIAIVIGNWLNIGYRALHGAGAVLPANDALSYTLLFEFKASIALFSLPLVVAAAYILRRYGVQLSERPWLRATVALLLAMAFFFFSVAFGLGVALARLSAP